MSAAAIGAMVFACTLGGALAGMRLRAFVPGHHLSAASQDTVKVGVGLIATMTALLLGLVTASAKSSFDALDAQIKHVAQDILVLDRLLARYGPETREIRAAMKDVVAQRIDVIWPQGRSSSGRPDRSPTLGVEALVDRLRALSPSNEVQRGLLSRAIDHAESVLATRWQALGSHGSSIPGLFLAVLSFWLTLTFASFGLFAPPNATVVAVLVMCALSVSGAVFLVLEMDGGFDGLIRASPEPLLFAHAHMNR